jgi:nucleotide-binding universal stress UspA family protein
MSFSRILIPVSLEKDGPALAEAALSLACCLLKEGGTISLLAVLDPAPERPLDQTHTRDEVHEYDQLVLGAGRQLREIGANAEGVKVEDHTTASEDVAQAIMDFAAKDADAIIITSHGRHGVKGVIMGSVATEVAKHATVPVVVYAGADR